MENSLVNESDVGVLKKIRSVKKRKSGGLNDSELNMKRCRNGLGDGGTSSLVKSDGPCVELGQELLSLDSYGKDIRVERKRGGCGVIKNHVKKRLSGLSSSVDQIAELNCDLKSGKTDTKSVYRNGSKCNKVNGGNASSRKGRSYGKKRKGLEQGSLEDEEKAKPVVDHGRCINEYSQGDEENLEQNAARMLSSRFDSWCTGRRSKSLLSHSDGGSGSHTGNLQGGSYCSSADNDSRILIPRYDYKEMGYPQKRRHFYEIVYREKDARWFLKKRIKVYWPLDDWWYHGLVNDYDEERKLHHVNYDDKDKEWISLQEERFMLLLLRSELTDVKKPLHSCTDDKLFDNIGTDLKINGVETNSGIDMDSEPIISWLARSSSQAKSSSGLKKQKKSHSSPNELPQSSTNIGNAHRNTNICLLEKETSEVCFYKSADVEANGRESMLDKFIRMKENRSPIVYFRRRFRKKTTLEAVSNILSSGIPVDSNGQRSLMSVAGKFQISDKKNVCSHHGFGSDKLMWSIGSDGLLKLNLPYVPFKEFVTQLSLSVCPLLNFSVFGSETFCFLRYLLLRESGFIVTTWPNVYLETLFVDNEVGLRFFLIEGCLKQAVAFVSLLLTVFCEPNQLMESVDSQTPATTIRFKVSCIQDLRKQYVFSFYSFSKLNHSHWLYLDSISQKRCLLYKKLPLTECTLENIKVLKGRSKHMPSGVYESSFQGTKSVQNIIPSGLSKPGNRYVRQSFVNDVRHLMLPFALSFSSAPPLFNHLHLNLLMRRSIASVCPRGCNPACSADHQGNTDKSKTNDQVAEQCSVKVVSKSTSGTSLSRELCFGCFSCSKAQLGTNSLPASVNCDRIMSSLQFENQNSGEAETDVIGESQYLECYNLESERIFTKTKLLASFNQASPVISGDGNCHSLRSISVEIPATDIAKSNVDGKWPGVQRAFDITSNISNEIVFSPDTSGNKSLRTGNERNLSSLPVGETSPVLHGGRTNLIYSVSSNGRRKARTQVHYSLPFGGSEFSSKHKPINPNDYPFRRIRRASEKRTTDGFKGSLRNLELLACDANVLITQGDRGWREPGGRVVLELAYRYEWRLAIKFHGSTKYSHKVDHVFLPGSTNRYTHAMMWKGGKDWALEFPDRSQWMLFKEMHGECYNRNSRVSLVKTIPIPGVRLVEEFEDNTTHYLFTRSSSRYIRQIETDIDMAMNPSNNFYEMDSEDELWILKNEKSFQTLDSNVVITDETFDKTMDMLEKLAYAQQCDHFTVDEIEKVMFGAPTEMICAIYQHWLHKRKKIGMPLIRHLQPPSWERYQQKVQEWNQLMVKGNTITSCGGKRKAPPVEKPIMFPFCLKPRGLEAPNKGLKHRSQKRFRVSGHAVIGDQDRVHTSGRRCNLFTVGDEKAAYHDITPENSDNISMLHTSTRTYLPSDAGSPECVSLNNDASDFDYYPNPCKKKSKKIGALMPLSNLHVRPSYNQRTSGKKNGVQQQNTYLPDWPSQKHHQTEVYSRHEIMQLGVQDLDEFGVREASGAARQASSIARFKRNKSHKLRSRADYAMQAAVSAIMAADAVKASFCIDG